MEHPQFEISDELMGFALDLAEQSNHAFTTWQAAVRLLESGEETRAIDLAGIATRAEADFHYYSAMAAPIMTAPNSPFIRGAAEASSIGPSAGEKLEATLEDQLAALREHIPFNKYGPARGSTEYAFGQPIRPESEMRAFATEHGYEGGQVGHFFRAFGRVHGIRSASQPDFIVQGASLGEAARVRIFEDRSSGKPVHSLDVESLFHYLHQLFESDTPITPMTVGDGIAEGLLDFAAHYVNLALPSEVTLRRPTDEKLQAPKPDLTELDPRLILFDWVRTSRTAASWMVTADSLRRYFKAVGVRHRSSPMQIVESIAGQLAHRIRGNKYPRLVRPGLAYLGPIQVSHQDNQLWGLAPDIFIRAIEEVESMHAPAGQIEGYSHKTQSRPVILEYNQLAQKFIDAGVLEHPPLAA